MREIVHLNKVVLLFERSSHHANTMTGWKIVVEISMEVGSSEESINM